METEKTGNTIEIPVGDLKAHPRNPRLAIREDVIDAIVAGLGDGFHQSHALQVYPDGGSYLILGGHHRAEAAKRAGIEKVPCWVRDDLSEDDAYMLLATDNAQGELSPLEVGMHALHYVDKEKGGRGNKGGLAAYAEKLGRNKGHLSSYRNAAAVARKCFNVETVSLLDKASQLAALHSLPQATWEDAVAAMVAGGWSAAETQERAKEAKEGATDAQRLALLTRKTSRKQLDRVAAIAESVAESFKDDPALKKEWLEWVKSEDPVDVRVVQEKRIEFEDRKAGYQETPEGALPSLVLADPPWQYDHATSTRRIENHYPSATIDEIISHSPRTEEDCILLMWAVAPKLDLALEVMSGWGFSFKTSAVWDKEKLGMGYWFRGQHELLLVGTKGDVSPPLPEARRSSVFREARGEHSRKPLCVYEWIEEAFPGAKLEMYCREARAGWQTWGNES